jgi:hypothetical protein
VQLPPPAGHVAGKHWQGAGRAYWPL